MRLIETSRVKIGKPCRDQEMETKVNRFGRRREKVQAIQGTYKHGNDDANSIDDPLFAFKKQNRVPFLLGILVAMGNVSVYLDQKFRA